MGAFGGRGWQDPLNMPPGSAAEPVTPAQAVESSPAGPVENDEEPLGWLHLMSVNGRKAPIIKVLRKHLEWDEATIAAFVADVPRTLPVAFSSTTMDSLTVALMDTQADSSASGTGPLPAANYDSTVLTPLELVEAGTVLRSVDPLRAQAPLRFDGVDARAGREGTIRLRGQLFTGTASIGATVAVDLIEITSMTRMLARMVLRPSTFDPEDHLRELPPLATRIVAIHTTDLDAGRLVTLELEVPPEHRGLSRRKLERLYEGTTVKAG